jgi:hypothetical protein
MLGICLNSSWGHKKAMGLRRCVPCRGIRDRVTDVDIDGCKNVRRYIARTAETTVCRDAYARKQAEEGLGLQTRYRRNCCPPWGWGKEASGRRMGSATLIGRAYEV